MRSHWTAFLLIVAAAAPGCGLPSSGSDDDYIKPLNLWPLATYGHPKQGEDFRFDGFLSLVRAERRGSMVSFRFLPLFETWVLPNGSDNSGLTIGVTDVLPIYQRTKYSSLTEFKLLGIFELASRLSRSTIDDPKRGSEPTSDELSVLELFGPVFRGYLSSAQISDDSSRVASREVLSALWGYGFHLYRSNDVIRPVSSSLEPAEQGTDGRRSPPGPVETSASHSFVKLLGGAFAVEDYEMLWDGNYEWRLLSLFESPFSLAREKGRSPVGGEEGWSAFQVLGPVYRSMRTGPVYESSLAFLYSYRDDGNESMLKLFHLIPLRI